MCVYIYTFKQCRIITKSTILISGTLGMSPWFKEKHYCLYLQCTCVHFSQQAGMPTFQIVPTLRLYLCTFQSISRNAHIPNSAHLTLVPAMYMCTFQSTSRNAHIPNSAHLTPVPAVYMCTFQSTSRNAHILNSAHLTL